MDYLSMEMECDLPWLDDAQKRHTSSCEGAQDYSKLEEIYSKFDSSSPYQLEVNTDAMFKTAK